MKRRHRVPTGAMGFKSDPVDDRYQAEVDLVTERAEREAVRRLEAAERHVARLTRLVKGKTTKTKGRELEVAAELVEIRREELLAIQRAMQSVPASSQHRTKRDRHRPAVPMKTL